MSALGWTVLSPDRYILVQGIDIQGTPPQCSPLLGLIWLSLNTLTWYCLNLQSAPFDCCIKWVVVIVVSQSSCATAMLGRLFCQPRLASFALWLSSHLLLGRPTVISWLLHIHSICDAEQVLLVLNCGSSIYYMCCWQQLLYSTMCVVVVCVMLLLQDVIVSAGLNLRPLSHERLFYCLTRADQSSWAQAKQSKEV